MTRPLLVVHDDAQHGVAAYARQLAAAMGSDATVPLAALDDLAAGTPVHLQFTDRLWASSPEAAADAIRLIARRHPLTVTLHDLPQPSDGERNLPRRAAAYAAVVAASRGAVCNSAHEAALLREFTDERAISAVIPLPVDAAPPGDEVSDLDDSVGVLGFFYPGKGHDEALDAAVAASVPRLTILGRASDGHDADLAAFAARGADAGVEVEVTGYLPDDALLRRCRRAGVPVVAHRHVSASGSLGSWIAAGRRPVVVRNRYVDEMARLRPGSMTVVEPDRLAMAVAACRAQPSRTFQDPGVTIPFGIADAAAAYRAWWRDVAWG